jgi:hypothetical protein
MADLKDEYLDIGENLRFYGNLRFAQLTLFFAVTGAIIAALFTINPPLPSQVRFLLKWVGLAMTILFWLMEKSSSWFWVYYVERAQVIEKVLGYYQYTGRNPKIRKQYWIWKCLNATNAVRGIFLVMFVFWLIMIIWHTEY